MFGFGVLFMAILNVYVSDCWFSMMVFGFRENLSFVLEISLCFLDFVFIFEPV